VNRATTDPRDTPVLLLVFNRPEHTARVWEQIRALQPKRLMVAADGPRADHPADAQACTAVREVVADVDWPCELSRRVSAENLGCRYGPASGISWAFELVDEAIILEDDCVPDPSFFLYCSELLQRYRDQQQVMSIGGHRWEGPDLPEGESYYFSSYPATWGWATWADRWQRLDLEMHTWPTLRASNWLQTLLNHPAAVAYWHRRFDAMTSGLDAWDYAWLFSCWRWHGLSIRPNVNLVENIGFGPDATHTLEIDHPAGRPASAMRFPLHHPAHLKAEPWREELLEWVNFSGVSQRRLQEAARRIQARRCPAST
jgi:hypothetical protein